MTDMHHPFREHFASTGAQISYLDFGGVGTPIILIHGLAGQGLEWVDTAIGLTGRGHVVAPDLRGHGGSDRHPMDVTPEAHARDIVRLIDHLGGGPAVVIGQSYGGVIAYVVAAKWPHYVKAIVVIEAGLKRPTEGDVNRTVGWLRSWPIPFKSPEEAEAFFDGGGIRGRTWASLLDGTPDGFVPAFDIDMMRRTLAMIGDYTRLWPRVSAPTLIVGGENGFVDKAEMHEMAGGAAGSYHEVPKAGHDLHLEAPEQWKKLLVAFLDRL